MKKMVLNPLLIVSTLITLGLIVAPFASGMQKMSNLSESNLWMKWSSDTSSQDTAKFVLSNGLNLISIFAMIFSLISLALVIVIFVLTRKDNSKLSNGFYIASIVTIAIVFLTTILFLAGMVGLSNQTSSDFIDNFVFDQSSSISDSDSLLQPSGNAYKILTSGIAFVVLSTIFTGIAFCYDLVKK